jgi:hypothetical protein
MDTETVENGGRESEVETGEERAVEQPGVSAEELAALCELALRAYPETVPELVAGASVAELLGSLESAAAAYRRIADGIGSRPPAVPTVPAGSAPPVTLDPERLPSVEKIRRGLAGR